MGFFFSSSSSLANRSRDEAALRMGLLDTRGSTNLYAQGNDSSSHAFAAFSRVRVGEARQAILPPPFLVMTSTEGLGGMLGSKSGQRVAGSAKVEARSKPL